MKLCYWLVFLGIALPSFAQLPDSRLTPGVIRTRSAAEICAPKFRTKPFRLTTSAMKKQVCAAYHVSPCPKFRKLEIDHLVPLELGGLDDVKNLWPQMAKYPHAPGFHTKDKLENELKRRVCTTKIMTLPDAQQCLESNWVSCYRRVMGEIPPTK